MRLRIAIVGYGTCGQASALLLAADGHDVEVFERAPALGPVGAGLLLQPTGLAVLWEIGLLDGALAHGAVVTRLYGQNQRGRPVMDMRYGDLDRRLFGLGLQRGALFALLDGVWREGRRIRCGCTITEVDAERGAFSDAQGRRHDGYDLIIIADGAASRLHGGKVGWDVWRCRRGLLRRWRRRSRGNSNQELAKRRLLMFPPNRRWSRIAATPRGHW